MSNRRVRSNLTPQARARAALAELQGLLPLPPLLPILRRRPRSRTPSVSPNVATLAPLGALERLLRLNLEEIA